MIRVGFVFSLDEGWLGGVNYLRNLLSAIYSLPNRQIEAVVFTGSRDSKKYLGGFPEVEIVHSCLFESGSLPAYLRRVALHGCSRDFLFEWILRRQRISVLSHVNWFRGNVRFPAIGWIPDFQHLHLPEFFSTEEIAEREKYFRAVCRNCSTILVSSFDAQTDLRRFDPEGGRKSAVLQFVVSPIRKDGFLPDREALEAKFNFAGKFFLLPNQFWKHKNHRLVIDALGLLRQEGKRVLVVATGNPSDYRHPDHFNSLLEHAKSLHVIDDFMHLGIVSAGELAGLMRDSLAIINPSLFEGWSTTVEEAKSLGKRVLLSDIPVHREQNPLLASYFQPDDANTLAARLWEIWNMPCEDEAELLESAQRTTNKRREEMAMRYQKIVLDVVGKHNQ